MPQLLSIVSCPITIHVWDQSASVFSILPVRWLVVDRSKLCHWPDEKSLQTEVIQTEKYHPGFLYES